jgi:hypothetical protein
MRSVPIVSPLIADLDNLRTTRGEARENELVFPARDGGCWSRSQYNNWRNRVWKPIMDKLASGKPPQPRLATAVPYDCRGSFISLQLRAGASPLEVAAWSGHSPQVMFQHYANVIDELVGEPRLSAEEQIIRAREGVEQIPRNELDVLMADLFDRPTVTGEGESQAANIFFAPRT